MPINAVMHIVTMIFIGLCCASIGVYCLFYGRRFRREAKIAWATVVDYTLATGSETACPVVQILDGEDMCLHRAQPTGRVAQHVSLGDKVKVMYTRRKALGSYVWNIFIIEGADGRKGVPYRAYDIVAGIMFTVSAVMVGMAILI